MYLQRADKHFELVDHRDNEDINYAHCSQHRECCEKLPLPSPCGVDECRREEKHLEVRRKVPRPVHAQVFNVGVGC